MASLPPPLALGSTIAVAAPASPFDRDELFAGLAWLRLRYRLAIGPRMLDRDGLFAGTDDVRASALARAMTDRGVDAIVCARGGYGAMRLLDRLPWDAFAARPKRLVGFSDVTALHVAAASRGIPTVHGPNVTGLGRWPSPSERLALIAALEGLSPVPWTGLEPLHDPALGAARGIVVGGNLALVEAMAAAGRLAIPPGAILVLEDVTERPYRIDRMLTALALGGHLARAGAIVFGDFTRCDAGPDGVGVLDVLRERTASLGVPVVHRAPFGHGARNHAFWLGVEATLAGGRLEWHL